MISKHSPLPTPDLIAQQHSEALSDFIRQEINAAGGYISFARYMELALYAPGLGYYSAGAFKFGKHGDFVTAPEISPLFAQSIARQCQQVLANLVSADILEIGPGSGILACELLLELERLGQLPQHYYLLEVSADLRERQQALLKQRCPRLLSRMEWLDTFPEKICGIILANEVLDAQPVHCFRIEKTGIKERCVSSKDNQFVWHIAEPTSAELTETVKALGEFAEGYESEINLLLPGWITMLANSLGRGLVLLLDYGFGQSEYYHPDRSMGTLMCHYQHHAHTDPLILTGLQDITAHVDFTAVANYATAAQLSLAGYTTQAGFLLACGITELANQRGGLTELEQYQQNQAIKMLTLPSEMGELVKVIGFTKELDFSLLGFSLFDRCRDL